MSRIIIYFPCHMCKSETLMPRRYRSPHIFPRLFFVSYSFISSRLNSIAFEYAKLLPRRCFLRFECTYTHYRSVVCMRVRVDAYACLWQAWLSCSRLPARDTCGRWSSAHTYVYTCACTHTRARMRLHVDHTITQYQDFAERESSLLK